MGNRTFSIFMSVVMVCTFLSYGLTVFAQGGESVPEEDSPLDEAIAAINKIGSIEDLELSHWHIVDMARLAVERAVSRGVAEDEISNMDLLTEAESKIHQLREDYESKTFRDDFDNYDKMHSKEGNFSFEDNPGKKAENDPRALKVKNRTTGSITYKTGSFNEFQLRLYFFPDTLLTKSNYDQYIKFYVSADNSNWTKVIPEMDDPYQTDDVWRGVTFSSSSIPNVDGGVDYFKVELNNSTMQDYSFLLSWIEYSSIYELPGEFELNRPNDGATEVEVDTVLRWARSSKAEYYKIILADNPDFVDPNIIEMVKSDKNDLKVEELLPGKTYYWKVIAKNIMGDRESETIRSFTTAEENIPAEPDDPSAYYIDSLRGNDSNDGRSQATPWKTFANVNARTFEPGEKILLRRGEEWKGQLHPKGSGTEDNPITIGSYGIGEKPLIDGEGMAGGVVYLKNQSNWVISDLQVKNYAPERGTTYRLGIFVENNNGGTVKNIQILDNDVYDVSGSFKYADGSVFDNHVEMVDPHGLGGISCYVSGKNATDKFEKVLIQGNTVKESGRTGIVVWDYLWANEGEASKDIVIRNNYVEEIDSDGIMTFGCNNVLMEYNVANGCGRYVEPGQFNGSAAIWPTRGDNFTVQFNEAYNTYALEGNADGQGFNVDIDSSNALVQYNYSHDNEGGFLLILDATGDPGTKKGSKNITVRHNISQNDGRHIINFAGGIARNVKIYNNTFYIGKGLKTDIIGHEWDIPENMGRPYEFKNNIIYNLGRGVYHIEGTNGIFDHNLYYGNHPASEPDDKNGITSNPLLVDPGSGGVGLDSVHGYKLASNSPAIGSGIQIDNNGGRDYWGNSVSPHDAPNIGAYNGTGDKEIPEGDILLSNAKTAIEGIPSIDSLEFSDWYIIEEARRAVNIAMDGGISEKDITNLGHLIEAETKLEELKVINPPIVFRDEYEDASKVYQIHGPWGINVENSDITEGDRTQAGVQKGQTGNISYKTGSIAEFSARLYHKGSKSSYGMIKFFVSSDHENWTQITPSISEKRETSGGYWGVTFSSDSIPELPDGVNYFRIELKNDTSALFGDDKAYLLAWTEFKKVLTAPGSFNLAGPKDGEVDLDVDPTFSWTPSTMADVYEVSIADNPDFVNPILVKAVGAETYSYKVSALSEGKTYYWKVRARNAMGDMNSDVRSFSTIPGENDEELLPPLNLRVISASETEITLGWDASEGEIDGYRVYKDGVLALEVNGTTAVISDLSPGTEYSFTVTSYNSKDESEHSEAILVKTEEETILTDKSKLEALIQYAKSQQEKDEYRYLVPAVKSQFEQSLEEAESTLADKDASQENVDKAYAMLLELVHMLSFTGNCDDLEVLIDAIPEDLSIYTDETVQILQEAKAAALRVLRDENALQDEIDSALKALQTALDNLEIIVVDKTKLINLINEAEKYDLGNYMEPGKTDFISALEEGKLVRDNPSATIEDVDEAYTRLLRAKFALREIPTKERLEELINRAMGINIADYTSQSVSKFILALEKAQEVYEDSEASQSDIEEAIENLEKGISQLELIGDEGGTKDEDDIGDENGTEDEGRTKDEDNIRDKNGTEDEGGIKGEDGTGDEGGAGGKKSPEDKEPNDTDTTKTDTPGGVLPRTGEKSNTAFTIMLLLFLTGVLLVAIYGRRKDINGIK